MSEQYPYAPQQPLAPRPGPIPQQQNAPQPPAPAPAKKARRWPFAIGGLVVGLILGVAIGSGGGSSSSTPAATAPASAQAAPSAPAAPAAAPAAATDDGSFGDGTHTVPDEVKPGSYTADGSKGAMGTCYWAREKDTTGDVASIIANGMATGPTTITIKSTDKAIETSGGCTWTPKK